MVLSAIWLWCVPGRPADGVLGSACIGCGVLGGECGAVDATCFSGNMADFSANVSSFSYIF